MNNQYQVTVIDSMEKWADFGSQWNKLLSQSKSDTVFLSWEWLFSWAETYLDENKKVFILTVFDENELIGIAPFCIRNVPSGLTTLKQLEFMGTPEAGSDYLDVFTKKGREKEVAKRIYEFILKECSSHWDCLLLRDIPSNSLFLLHLLNRIEDDGKYMEIRQGSFCPVVSLPETINDFELMLSSHRRQQFKRHHKLLGKQGEVRHHIYKTDNMTGPLNEFFRLFSDTRGAMEPRLSLFLERFSKRSKNSVQVDFLTSAETKIAGLVLFNYNNTLSMYLMAIDKEFNPHISIGNILVGLGIYRAIDDGISTYDFLKGDEHYKFHWASEGRRSLNVRFSQKKIAPLVSDISRLMKYAAKMAVR